MEDASKGHTTSILKTIYLFGFFMSLSFAPTKESNQRKVGRKRQLQPFLAKCLRPHTPKKG
jgi:hypothetical protein